MKNSMIIDVANYVKVVCYREDMLTYFYAEHDYTEDILDILYDTIKSCAIDSITCIVHGFWSTKPYDGAYISGCTVLGGARFFSNVNQLDVNKLQHLFTTCNVSDVTYVDAFAAYGRFAEAEDCNVCVIDRVESGLVLAAYTKNDSKETVLREIFYVVPASLGKYITMLKRKYNIEKFIESADCKYVGDVDCSKFNPKLQQKICALSAALEAQDGFKIDNDKISFSPEFNSYQVSPEVSDVKVAEQPKMEEEPVADENLAGEQEKPVELKSKGKGTSVLLTILVILCILSLIGVVFINNLIKGDINGLKNKIKSLQVDVSSLKDVNTVLEDYEDLVDYDKAYSTLDVKDVSGVELAAVSFQGNECTATYLVAGEEKCSELLSQLGSKYDIVSIVETSSKESNGVVYSEKAVTLDL